jgi:hypothetical protein
MPTYTKEKPMPMTLQNLDELQRGWAEAEIAADTEALDAIAIEDFMLVGPAGFVLSKQQWLERS